MPWVYDPHTGGTKIPPAVRTRIEQRILKYAAKHPIGKHARIAVRFHGPLCYIDAYVEPKMPRDRKPPAGETRAQ